MINSNPFTNCLIDATRQGAIDWSPPSMGTQQEKRRYDPWLFASAGAFDLRLAPTDKLEIVKNRVIYNAKTDSLYKTARQHAGLRVASEEEIEEDLTQRLRQLMHEHKK